ncbi:unnamed protein product [Somion occarium]|uniref:Pheromone receptor n=1 Tax=Somion occarium TaxID=3059160 RepID=A0ABP1CSA1_9APHY
MSDPTYPAFPILTFFAAVLVLIPLPWHLQSLNAGTCLFMIWTAIACINLGINSIIWHSNAIDWAPVWCDISSRIIVAVAVAIPAASFCINRRLYMIATIQTRHRAVIIDLLIGIGIPLLQVVMQYVVSGHRYDIFEDIGCYPFTYNVTLAYPLSVVWPIVIGLASAVYCVLTLRAFSKRRAQFSEFLSSKTSLSPNRYFRLMALATTELLCTTPISLYGMILNLTASHVHPWISWEDTHSNYSKVAQYPALLWRMDRSSVIGFEMTRWAPFACALVFFAFFGFADEARRNYRQALSAIAKLLRIRTFYSWRSAPSKVESLPSFVASPLPPYTPSPSKSRFRLLMSSSSYSSTTKTDSYNPSLELPVFEICKSDLSAQESIPETPSTSSSHTFILSPHNDQISPMPSGDHRPSISLGNLPAEAR